MTSGSILTASNEGFVVNPIDPGFTFMDDFSITGGSSFEDSINF